MYSSNNRNNSINQLPNSNWFLNSSALNSATTLRQLTNNGQQNTKQLCPSCKDYKLGAVSFSLCNECENSDNLQYEDQFNNEPNGLKLMEIAAKVVAQHYPFQSIEERYERIPEPVQRRIIYWSFPQNEDDICMYSSLNLTDEQKLPFKTGIRLVENDSVNNVLQVGFHLSGTVNENVKSNSYHSYQSGNDLEKKYRVSITFDRCKITSVTCSCDKKDIFWCPHVVALAIYRIRFPRKVKLRVPISETLLQLDKYQLQKLVQFLISEHHTEVLPTAQSLADKMLNRNSILNLIKGAPDPTAGAGIEQENCWHLDEQQVTKQVTHFLAPDGYLTMNKNINALFGKVKEMLKARDSNASRMLRLITEQFLNNGRLVSWRNQGQMADKYRQLWDQLVALWVYIALNPHATLNERKKISDLLFTWTQNPNCPLEDTNYRLSNSQLKRKMASNHQLSDDEDDNSRSGDELIAGEDEQVVNELLDDNNFNERRRPSQSLMKKQHRKKKRYSPRTIFHRALEASFLKWDHPHLCYIIDDEELKTDNKNEADCFTKSSTSSTNRKNCNVFNCSSSGQLQSSSNLFNSQDQPLWNEPIPIACARVEALRCHGYQKAALKLAISIVRSMKKEQQQQIASVKVQEKSMTIQSDDSSNRSSNYYNSEGWIGNPLDSISTLFDTLAEASLTPDSKPLEFYYGMYLGDFKYSIYSNLNGNTSLTSNTPLELNIPQSYEYNHESFYTFSQHQQQQRTSSQFGTREKPKYLHIKVEDSRDMNETYISLALEAALIGLGQQRLMPNGEYLQDKSLRQEERMIAKLHDLEYNPNLIATLCKQAKALLEGGPYSGLGLAIHPESVPMHVFARYLFNSLLNFDADLAYKVGLRAIRLPILEGFNNFFEDLNNNNSLMNNNHNRSQHHFSNLYYQNLNHNNNYLYPFLNNHPFPNHNRSHYNRSNHHHHHHHHHHHQNNHHSNAGGNWHVLHLIEIQQCSLAITMILAAKNDSERLQQVQTEAQKNIHTSIYLFQLAQEAFRNALPPDNSSTANNNSNSNSVTSSSSINNHHLHHQTHHQQLSYLHHRLNSTVNTVNHPYSSFNFNFGWSPAAAANFSLAHNANNLVGQNFKNNVVNNLLKVAYELGLQVVKMTLPQSTNLPDNKRKEIVKWIVNCAIEIGYPALYYLMQFWSNLFTPIEAVGPVAGIIMSPNVMTKVNNILIQREQENLCAAARHLAVECAKKDPTGCALPALALCESDQSMFQKCYLIVADAGMKSKMSFPQLIAVAKYIDGRGFPEWAYKLSQLAIKTINIAINPNSEQVSHIADIHWVCSLAHSLGKDQLSKLVPILIENIQCAHVLSDILRRCTSNNSLGYPLQNTTNNQQSNHQANQQFSYPYLGLNSNSINALTGGTHYSSRRHHPYQHHKLLALDKDPLKALLDASIAAYVNATHSKLHSISPRHYTDFVEFLVKAKETFLLANDGENKFTALIETIRTTYKGKKKLMKTIREKFPLS